jgi:NADPH-ferrihemoprotein reductase
MKLTTKRQRSRLTATMQSYPNLPSNALDGDVHDQRARLSMYQQLARMGHVQGNYQNYGYVSVPSSAGLYDSGTASMTSLDQSFSGLSVQGHNPLALAAAAPGSMNPTGLNLVSATGNGQAPYVVMHQGKMLVALPGYTQHESYNPGGRLSPGLGSFDQAHYQQLLADRMTPAAAYQNLPVTPQPRPVIPRVEVSGSDVAGLADRKSSQGSANDREHSSSPDTPHQVHTSQVDDHVIIARSDRSPQVHYEYRTPSPAYLLPYEQAVINQAVHVPGLNLPVGKESFKLADLGIPLAITAVYDSRASRKSMEASLYNATGTTNVYIRGFSPETNDEMLHAYASRFGNVATSKAMIDNQTGACKG